MNFNVWNIKEMLGIPSGSGTTKSSNWINNQTDYSSLSDSQFLFGSQFCPENSETLLAPLDFGAHLRHPKQSQQNSLDSEPSIFTKYQAKPQLFGGDTKDGGLFPPPLSIGKSKGLLEEFEEKKKRAKDKCDSYRHLWKSLRNISVQEANLFWILWRLWPRHVSASCLRYQHRALASCKRELSDLGQVSSGEILYRVSERWVGTS
uniref:Interactor of HORMAD1 1 n=1 Tax=Propithecus coquereli TaxID=379532 RepID=A0A2K6G730_PROCO